MVHAPSAAGRQGGGVVGISAEESAAAALWQGKTIWLAYLGVGWHIKGMLTEPIAPPKRRLEEQFRAAIRVRGYSLDTERSYWMWVRQFILREERVSFRI